MPTSDQAAAVRMFSRKLHYLLANLCDLLDFWFARMKQRKASPKNRSASLQPCPGHRKLPHHDFQFFIYHVRRAFAQLTFFFEKHTYINWFPLEKLKVFMLCRIFWDWGKEPFLAVSTQLFFTLRGVPPANACASRHTGNLKPYALSLGLLPVTGGRGFGRDSMVVGNLEM